MIAFEVTTRCRFACPHCRAAAGPGADGGLDTAQCLQVISSIADYCRCTLILTGGEPTERSDLIELVEAGRGKGLRMVMATCGYNLDDRLARQLRQAGIEAIAFSLDGPDPKVHDMVRGKDGAFETIIEAAGAARRAGLPFQINTTITKLNVGCIVDIARLAKDMGATCFNPFILVPTGRARKMLDKVLDGPTYEQTLQLLAQIPAMLGIQVRVTCGPQFVRVTAQRTKGSAKFRTHGCMGGIGFGFISHKGDVQACGFLDLVAGNLVENGYDFAAIWERSWLLSALRNRAAITGQCRSCAFLDDCGGCRARAYCISGDYLASDPVCKGPYPAIS